MSHQSKSINMKEVLISDPRKVLKFYDSQQRESIITDSTLSDMISLNKAEASYVIPIDKEKRVRLKQSTSVNIIDPNAAAINQAKENIKNDKASGSQNAMNVTSRDNSIRSSQEKRKQPSQEKSCSQSKKPKPKRRKTVVNGDIFGEE